MTSAYCGPSCGRQDQRSGCRTSPLLDELLLPLLGGRWCGSRNDARPLIRELDARFANDLGIFFRVRRIKLCNLVGTHGLHRLQGLLLQRPPDARNLHYFVETGHDLVDDRLRCAAWGSRICAGWPWSRGRGKSSISVRLGTRDLIPGEVAACTRLRFDHDRLLPNLGKLVGNNARGDVDDPT